MDRGTVTEGDFATLAIYAEIYSRWVDAKRSIATDGLMIVTQVTDNNGNLRTVSRINPLIKVAEGCESRMLSFCRALGLTPADRDKVKQTSVNPKEEIVPGSIADLYPHLVKGKS
jgi:P27 family predicted phage terminase small subunit